MRPNRKTEDREVQNMSEISYYKKCEFICPVIKLRTFRRGVILTNPMLSALSTSTRCRFGPSEIRTRTYSYNTVLTLVCFLDGEKPFRVSRKTGASKSNFWSERKNKYQISFRKVPTYLRRSVNIYLLLVFYYTIRPIDVIF